MNTIREVLSSLNPCFNGRYSRSWFLNQEAFSIQVLILVLMEDTLGDQEAFSIHEDELVLILVLMEDTLGGWAR